LRREEDDIYVLFIERAFDDRDPWSGNIGFPGGRRSPDDPTLRHAAERETWEEVGIDLGGASAVGRLADIVGANLPVRVSCFVYLLDHHPLLALNAEVKEAFWVSLDTLRDTTRHVTSLVTFAGKELVVPSITILPPGRPVLWGITYRLITQFLGLLETCE
jgi:8-oxo-dGTP pyrophosphatase MutT (NUDIX family)